MYLGKMLRSAVKGSFEAGSCVIECRGYTFSWPHGRCSNRDVVLEYNMKTKLVKPRNRVVGVRHDGGLGRLFTDKK